MDEVNVRRFLRHAMTNRIFKEVSPGVVAHTAASKVIAEDKALQDWLGFNTEDMFPVSDPSHFLPASLLPCSERVLTRDRRPQPRLML